MLINRTKSIFQNRTKILQMNNSEYKKNKKLKKTRKNKDYLKIKNISIKKMNKKTKNLKRLMI